MPKQCKIDGCKNNVFTHGYCHNHKGYYYKSKPRKESFKPFKEQSKKSNIGHLKKEKSLKKAKITQIKEKIIRLNGDVCFCCGKPTGNDAAHIFPISLFPEYETAPWNIILLCRGHHEMFDDGNYRDVIEIPNIDFILEVIESIDPKYLERLKRRGNK